MFFFALCEQQQQNKKLLFCCKRKFDYTFVIYQYLLLLETFLTENCSKTNVCGNTVIIYIPKHFCESPVCWLWNSGYRGKFCLLWSPWATDFGISVSCYWFLIIQFVFWLFNLYMINQSNKITSSTIRMKWCQVGLSLFCYARVP